MFTYYKYSFTPVALMSMKIDISIFIKLPLSNLAFENCFMQQKINAIFTKRVLDLNGSLSLTHIWRMDSPIVIIWVSPLSYLEASGKIF